MIWIQIIEYCNKYCTEVIYFAFLSILYASCVTKIDLNVFHINVKAIV